MDQPALDELEGALGYHFHDRALLMQALTHSSRKAERRCSNERMEFLGDAILGAAVSEYLYRRFPDYSEGDLTRVKSIVVSRTSLARAAKEMNLAAYLLVAKGVGVITPEVHSDGELPPDDEAPRCRTALPVSLLANALEAIIAAVYLDSGIRMAYSFVLRNMRGQIEKACETIPEHNFKSALQEYAQRVLGATPVYRVTAETGPDHVKSFEVVTVIAGQPYGTGHGRTKKEAEQMAAQLTLDMVGFGAEPVKPESPDPEQAV